MHVRKYKQTQLNPGVFSIAPFAAYMIEFITIKQRQFETILSINKTRGHSNGTSVLFFVFIICFWFRAALIEYIRRLDMNQKQNKQHTRSAFKLRMITTSGLVIAAYMVMMYLTQSISFGQYQMRLATSLYALAAIHPFLILPLGMANFLSNALFGGLGLFDIIGGFMVGIITAAACRYFRKMSVWLVGIPILVLPSLIVPIWLSALLGIPYLMLVVSVGIGQTAPAILAVFLVKYLEGPLKKIQEEAK